MKKFLHVYLMAVLLLGVLAVSAQPTLAKGKGDAKVLEFDTLVGVPRPYTGAANAIRGVPGGGLPWVVGSAVGELKTNGDVEVKVTGLVLDPTDQAVIDRGLAGVNPSAQFKVIVSCLSKDAAGAAMTVNVSSGLFPATPQGNASIEDHLSLPSPCIAPILFVTSPAGAWFAATGF